MIISIKKRNKFILISLLKFFYKKLNNLFMKLINYNIFFVYKPKLK